MSRYYTESSYTLPWESLLNLESDLAKVPEIRLEREIREGREEAAKQKAIAEEIIRRHPEVLDPIMKKCYPYKVYAGIEECKNSRSCEADRKGIRSGVIIFQRENGGRLKAEKAEYLFEFCGVLVACVEDKSGMPDFERKDFNGLDFVLLPKQRLKRHFPAEEEFQGKVICYYEEDPFLELMNCIDQEEAEEIRKIYQMITEHDLYPMIYTLRYENTNIFWKMVENNRIKVYNSKWKELIKNKIYNYELLETLINSFPAKDDFLNAYHSTFTKWYLKFMQNRVMEKYKYVKEYDDDFKKAEKKSYSTPQPKAFIHLIATDLFHGIMTYAYL